jgi:hypothetical protein
MPQLTAPRLLRINVTRLDPTEAYGSGSFPSQPWKFRARFLVEPQIHSDMSTPRPGVYNGLDVQPGDFITTQKSKILKINQIESQTASQIVCICSDINRLNSSVDEGQTGESAIETGYGLLFTVRNGVPVLFPLPGNIQGLNSNDLIGIIGRFFYSDAAGFVGGETGFTGSKGDTGFTGSRGAQGTSISIQGSVATSADLPATGNTINDAYFTDDTRELWVWSANNTWFNAGQIVGPQGDKGYTGSQGFTGSRGFTGYTGSRGQDGLPGITGFTGSIGFTGSRGVAGPIGPIGFTGSQGYIGSKGERGDPGFRGYQGYTGSQGVQGPIGPSGFTGSIGYTGSRGVQGFPGDIGYTGSLGYTGSQGPIGFTGSRGATGFTGSQGFQGEIGYTGSRGYTGSKGDQGPNAIGGASISQEQAPDGSVLLYREAPNQWGPSKRLDSQTVEGGFF